ncbi:MAG: helix-turn-helix domain-containing protein [bacterium]
MKNNSILTTFQISQFCNVNISTVIHWINTSKLKAYRTPGGHRRVSKENFIEFLKQYSMPIPPVFKE